MSSKRRRTPRDSHTAPDPEGPDEVYRRFQRLNGRGVAGGLGGLRELAESGGKKLLYGAFVVVEAAAIVLGLFFDVPFMDIVALGLPGLLVMFHSGSKDEEESSGEPGEKGLLDRLRELVEDRDEPARDEDRRRTGGQKERF